MWAVLVLRLLLEVGWYNTFSAFYFCFLHLYGPVRAVEFVVEATCIADGVAALVSSPEWCYCCAAILASDDDGGRSCRRRTRLRIRCTRLVGPVGLLKGKLCCFRDSVVVGRASVATVVASSPIAAAAARTSANSRLIC